MYIFIVVFMGHRSAARGSALALAVRPSCVIPVLTLGPPSCAPLFSRATSWEPQVGGGTNGGNTNIGRSEK